MPLSVGEKLGPYEILALVGKGVMGEVYRAHDSRLSRDVAIKVSSSANASSAKRMGTSASMFSQESIRCHIVVATAEERGTHAELLVLSGLYSEFYGPQLGS